VGWKKKKTKKKKKNEKKDTTHWGVSLRALVQKFLEKKLDKGKRSSEKKTEA